MQKPYDQGNLGSCTANAVAGVIEYDRLLDGWDYSGTPSRLFIYYCERLYENDLGQGDTGAFGRDGFKAMRYFGAPPESEWRYDISAFQLKPPDAVWTDAKNFILEKRYKSIQPDVNYFKQALSNNQTIAFGFTVFSSFEDPAVMRSGIVPMPNLNTENQLGGHETVVIGYLEAYPNHALVRNSWGTNVYDGLPGADKYGGGYFLMPWEYILSPSYSGDWRTIVRAAAHTPVA